MSKQCRGTLCWSSGVLLMLLLATVVLSQQSSAIQYVYDDLGRLMKIVDQHGDVAEYVYDAVGNILEIRRSTVTGLALLNFTPSRGPVGTHITLQGQGFSTTPAENAVTFNGTATTVLTAAPTQLVVSVPPGATTGPMMVTVAGQSASSDRPFVVLPAPVITAVAPPFTLAGAVISALQIQGENLTDVTFMFASIRPLVTINAVTIDPAGTSAVLNVTVRANVGGIAVLVATNQFRIRSDANPTTMNSLRVFDSQADDDGDGLTNGDELARGIDPTSPDTDGDGIADGDEVALGTAPGNAASQPMFRAQSAVVTFLNAVADSDGDGFTDQDETVLRTDPQAVQEHPPGQAQSAPVTYLNAVADSDSDGIADGDEVALGTAPGNAASQPMFRAQSAVVMFLNAVADSDGDGFTDQDETVFRTDPQAVQEHPPGQAQSAPVTYLNAVADSDSDGFTDRDEVALGTHAGENTSQPTVFATSAVVSYRNALP
ncbi:MAG: IPT/TIG domain-containing protein [Candidatus Tectimicrobiota bacterium]